jgi:hypothetical protein
VKNLPAFFSHQNKIKLEINSKRNYRKYPKAWILNNSLLNNQWVIEEIREGNQRIFRTNDVKTQQNRTFGTQKILY